MARPISKKTSTTPKSASGATSTRSGTTRTSATTAASGKAAPKEEARTVTKIAAKAANPAPAAPLSATEEASADAGGPEMKKQELVQKVVERSGIKKRDAKPVVEAMLSVLGDALAEGRELDLQPLGKVMLNRSNDKSNARIIFAKIRQSKKHSESAKDTVAVTEE